MSSDAEKADSRTLLELKKHIKADAKVHIHSCLARVKENQQCCKRFIKAGGLKLLVDLLRYQDQKVINAALSILANVCLNLDVRQQVQGTNIVSYTLWILNNLEVGDTLHCRACRLIGNLSDCSSYAKAFYDANAIKSLNYVLRNKANPQTYTMAIRAIRNIWSMYDGSHRKIIESGVIKSITSIFINAGKKTESKYIDLSEACMKALLAFLNSSNFDCASQMIGEKKEGFRTLVKFYEAQNKLAIKCVYYLATIPECRPLLGDCDAVEATVLLVKSCSFYLKEIIASLCLFCREAVNRIRIRYCDGLQVILDLLRKEDHERYHPLLLHGLTQFVCDDDSISIMVKDGLLDILTNKLQKMSIELPDETDEKALPKKRMADRSPYKNVDAKFNRTNSGRFSLDYPQDDWSPRSTRSDSLTPPSTPPMKLLGDVEDADDVAEENYSPVCSDNEWSDQEPQEEVESLKSFSSATIEVEEAQEKVSKTELNKHINAWTLVLLSKLSYSDDPIDRLADPATIGPLSTYVRLAKNPKASRILVRIVKNKAYLIPLIKQCFVFDVQNLSGHEQYTRQLCQLAETGGAVGELSSILLRGQETHRSVIALSIPFLIKSKDVLRQLLKNYGGLPLIFDVLSNSEHNLHKEAIWSVCQLADSLDLRPEGIDTKNQSAENGFVYHDASLRGVENHVIPSTVTFELDDGTTVNACRRLLCQRSEAFSAMLEGNFSESGKRCVKLRNTSKDGLNTLLLAINGWDFDHRTIESLLDAVVLADKFLMADISELLTESSISKINYENCCRAWSWARSNQCNELRLCCVKSFLTTNMTRAERVRAFQEFSNSENFKEFLEEVKEIISNVLIQR